MADMSVDNTTTRKSKTPACLRCNLAHKKCVRKKGETRCELCKTKGVPCEKRTPLTRGRPPNNAGPSRQRQRQHPQEQLHQQPHQQQQQQQPQLQQQQQLQLQQQQQYPLQQQQPQQLEQRQVELQHFQQQNEQQIVVGQQLQLQPEQPRSYVQIQPRVVPNINNDYYNNNTFQYLMDPHVWYTNSGSTSSMYQTWQQPQMPRRRFSDSSNSSGSSDAVAGGYFEEEASNNNTMIQTWPQTEEGYYGDIPPPNFNYFTYI